MSIPPAENPVVSQSKAAAEKEPLQHEEREPELLLQGKSACAVPDSGTPGLGSHQEVDLWWCSYSGWTMLPSFVVCLVLTAVIFWLVSHYLPHRGLVQLTILGTSSAVWLAQVLRWGHRFFGFNYRLTTRRLFYDRGFLYTERHHIELARIVEVRVARNRFERLVGVGRIYLQTQDRQNVVIEGVRQPMEVARRIREAVGHVRETSSAGEDRRECQQARLSAEEFLELGRGERF
jgi:membrane protein YdbS with pleckstrin-like domain